MGSCTSLLYGTTGASINTCPRRGPSTLSKSARLGSLQVMTVCGLGCLSAVVRAGRLRA
jgi:hypothetical protein